MNLLILFAGGMVALTAMLILLIALIKRKAESLLEDREALTDDEIYQRFYASSGLEREAVAGLWHEVAHILRVPADRYLCQTRR